MVWQDIVIFIGQFIFIVALIPTIRSKDKPQVSTSLVTGIILVIFTITFATLELWFSVVSSGALAIAWLYVGWQKHEHKKKR